MKIEFITKDLLASISSVSKATDSKATTIYNSVLIKTVGKDLIKLVGFNNDLYISATCPCTVIEEGSICVPPKKFADFVKAMPDTIGKMTTSSKNEITLTSSNTKFKLSGRETEGFAEQENIESSYTLNISSDSFKSLVDSTVFCASKDSDKAILNGCNLLIENGSATMVACDGKRIAKRTVSVDSNANVDLNVIIPTKPLKEVINFSSSDSEKVDSITITTDSAKKKIMFTIGNSVVIASLIVGSYIDFRSIIKDNSILSFTTDTAEFLGVCNRSVLVSSKHPLVFDIKPSKALVKTSISFENNEITEVFQVDDVVGNDDLLVAFDPSLLRSFFSSIGDTRARLSFSGATSPLLITPIDRSESFLFLVLPIRL